MALATPSEVSARLGRDLTEAEETQAEQVIETVTALIVDAVDRDSDWAEDLDPVPAVLRGICIEKAIGAIANPQNLAAESKSLGSFSSSRTFPRSQDGSVFLTPTEERIVANAVYGSASGSGPANSMITDVIDLREGRDAGRDPV